MAKSEGPPPDAKKIWAAMSGRPEQAGMFLATASIANTFQPALMPRSTMDQALVTGIVISLDYAIGALVQDAVEAAALWLSSARVDGGENGTGRVRRYAMALDLAALGLGIALQKACEQKEGEGLRRAGMRAGGFWLGAGALGGLVAGAFQEGVADLRLSRGRNFPFALPAGVLLTLALETRRHAVNAAWDDGSDIKPLEALGLSAGVAAGLAGLSTLERTLAHAVSRGLARILPGRERMLRPLGHAAAVWGLGQAMALLMRGIFHTIEEGATRLEPAYDQAPVSGSVSGGRGSLVPWETLSRQGRRYVCTYLRTEWIELVMREPPAAEPIRVFVGLDSAPTEEERVELAVRELERTGAFDRSLLMVISPTGTGYTNYVAVESAEYMTRGDLASVVMQYSKRPSVLSLDRVPEGRQEHRMLLEAVQERLRERPPEKRPRVVLFGESLGAWTSEAAFEDEGTAGLLKLGVERGLWIGTPYMCKWKDQVLGPPRPDVDRELLGVFNDFGQMEAMDAAARARLRYVMINHFNDAIGLFSGSLLVRKPEWLADDLTRRPPTVPPTERYSTPATFVLTLVDMKNAANVVPGQFEAKGHDYRADLARFVREVYALDITDEQLERIERALRRYELDRAEWIEKKDKPGKGEKAKKEKAGRKREAKD